MENAQGPSSSMCGQTLVLAVVMLGLSSTLMFGLFRVSLVAQEKIRLQLSADMAVLSTLNSQANGLNAMALANRALLANDALAGQLNALVSETTFYRKLAEKFQKLLRLVPYAGATSSFIFSGTHIIEKALRKAATVTLPLVHLSNIALRKGQQTIRHLLPICSLKAARSTLKENMPQAQITIPSKTLVLHQARSLQQNLIEGDPTTAKTLKAQTMDRHTLRRNWSIQVAGFSPAKKTGGTTILPDDLLAQDKLRLKVFQRLGWRWKTVIRTESRVSDFGYQTPADFLSIDTNSGQTAFGFPIFVQAVIPVPLGNYPSMEVKLFAVSAGRLTYMRPSRTDEAYNVFNPFWRSELIPVASEPTARRIVPEVLLKEVRH